MSKPTRTRAQEDLALALGAAAAFLSLPDTHRDRSAWLTRMTKVVKDAGFLPMDPARYSAVARALRHTGFADHLTELRELRDDPGSPFTVDGPDVDELVAAMQMAVRAAA